MSSRVSPVCYNSRFNYTCTIVTKQNGTTCYSNCAQCLLALKEYNSAVSMCNEALLVNAVHGKTLCRRGIAYMRQGLLELARKDFDE